MALQSGRLFLWLPVALGVGITGYFALRFEPSSPQLLRWGAGVGLLIALALWLRIRPLAFWITASALGFALAVIEAHSIAAPKLSYRYYGPVEGRIVAIDRSARERPRVTLDQVRLARIPLRKMPHRVRISLHFETSYVTLRPGQRVVLTAHLSPPSGPVEPGGFDFERHAWFQGLGAVGYSRTPLLEIAPPKASGFALHLTGLRQKIAQAIHQRLPGSDGAFAAAILVGDRSTIEQSDLDALRAANLAHLLAISGLHMGLLTGFVFTVVQLMFATSPRLALRLPVRRIAAAVAILTAIGYLAISGASIATQRAFLMALVIFVAVFLERRAITLRAVALAATLLLVLRPHGLNEAGFQMSFAATIGLVAVFSALRDKTWSRGGSGRIGRAWGWFLGLLISSFVAGAATAPFSAFHFNQISHFGLLANLLSVPVMGFVIMPAAVVATLLAPLGIDGIAWPIVGAGIRWILLIAHWVAGFEQATRAIVKPENWVFGFGCAGLIWLVLWQGWLKILSLPVLIIAVVSWAGTKRPDILITDDGRFLGLQSDRGRALSRAKGHGFAASSWLENDGDARDQETAAADFTWPEDIRLSTKKDAPMECEGASLLILPARKTGSVPDCLVLNEPFFRREGSVAIWRTPQGMILRTARGYSGNRVWSQSSQ